MEWLGLPAVAPGKRSSALAKAMVHPPGVPLPCSH
jgi:hypothetical protein